MDNEDTEYYFDNLALSNGVNKNDNVDKYDNIKKLLASQKTHPLMLECGGGAGFYTLKLLQDGFEVTCIDISNKALKENRKNAITHSLSNKLITVEGDFTDIAVKLKSKFDQIVFIKVFHHFESLVDIKNAINVAVSQCENGGRIVIFEPNGKNILWKFFLSLTKAKGTNHSKWYYEQNMKFTTASNFKQFLDESNLSYKIAYKYVIPAMLLKKERLFSKKLNSLNDFLEKTPLKIFSFNISIIINC